MLLLGQADPQHLLGIVPLVQGGVGVQPFVALQPDQVRLEAGRQHLGHFGLAHAGVPLNEGGHVQLGSQIDGRGDVAIGDVALGLHLLLDAADAFVHRQLR